MIELIAEQSGSADKAEKNNDAPQCKNNHTLVKIGGNWECGDEDCKDVKSYYPINKVNHLEGNDIVREKSILNNDTTSFLWRTDKKEDQDITRKEALEKICKSLNNRKILKKRTITDWANPTMHGFFASENNNVAVVNKLFKNVLIRWDKDFQQIRTMFGWSKTQKDYAKDEKREGEHIISEIIINYTGDELLKF